MNRHLSEHFTLEEFCRTSTGIPNIPNMNQVENLTALCDNVLEPARLLIDMPIVVTSGYRNGAVNTKVGGAINSQHRTGEAVDIKCYDNMLLFKTLVKLDYFDQLIYERGNAFAPAWIHVSFSRRYNRKQLIINI